MKLYRIKVNDNFTSYSMKGYDEHEECKEIKQLADKWETKKMTETYKRKDADLAFCWLPMNHLLISQDAVEKIKTQLNFEEIELLPAKKGKKLFYLFHGIKADKLTCDIVQKGIKMRYVFDENELKACGIDNRFVIKAEMNHGVLSQLLYTEKFVSLINELGLQGVDFDLEWDSEAEN